jgi:hypothetical protein
VAAEKPPAPSALSCAEVVDKIPLEDDDRRETFRARLMDDCTSRGWSDALRTCLAGATGAGDITECARKHDDRPTPFADAMKQFADEMCACATAACAESLFERVKKVDETNAGHKVSAREAEIYAKAGERIAKCYADVMKQVAP